MIDHQRVLEAFVLTLETHTRTAARHRDKAMEEVRAEGWATSGRLRYAEGTLAAVIHLKDHLAALIVEFTDDE